MDFIVALPKMLDYDSVLIVTDKFLKKVLLILGNATLTAEA